VFFGRFTRPSREPAVSLGVQVLNIKSPSCKDISCEPPDAVPHIDDHPQRVGKRNRRFKRTAMRRPSVINSFHVTDGVVCGEPEGLVLDGFRHVLVPLVIECPP